MNISLEKIDPNLVSKRKLFRGAEIPATGLGTFGSDRFAASEAHSLMTSGKQGKVAVVFDKEVKQS